MTGNLYFAYGSNMDTDQMAFRELEVDDAWGAVLEGHRLVFNFPARSRWLGGAANVVREEGSRVEGVLYALVNDISIMDDWESGYQRVAVDVFVPTRDEKITAWTYVVIEKGSHMAPSEVYVEQMLKGAKEFDLSRTFIDELDGHRRTGYRELGDHVLTVRALATAIKPLALEELAEAVDRPVDRVEIVLSDLGRWGWVQANNEPPVFRIVEGKEQRSPWVLM